MVGRTITPIQEFGRLPQFPDFPPRYDMQPFLHLHQHAIQSALDCHFKRAANPAVVGSQIPVSASLSARGDIRIPNLMVAFGIDCDLMIRQWGYEIERQGKAPDFALELAPPEPRPPGAAFEMPPHPNGLVNFAEHRLDYERYGTLEYWQLDPGGVQLHDAALAGDRMLDGRYVPIAITSMEDGALWGYSEALELYICWEDRVLRFYDPMIGEYLRTHSEVVAENRMAEGCATDSDVNLVARYRAATKAARAKVEAASRLSGKARIATLEAEVRRLRRRARSSTS